MRKLRPCEIQDLRRQHKRAVETGDKSGMIRKGCEVVDETEPKATPYSQGKRLLTDEEIAEITGPAREPTDERQSQAKKPLTVPDFPTVQWTGDPVASMPPASALLAADQREITPEEEARLLVFFDGEQWDTVIREARLQHARPCLTVNRLPLLVAAALGVDPEMALKPGRGYSPNQEDALHRLILIVTRRNMDAQKVYNFMCSAAVERAACPRTPFVVPAGTLGYFIPEKEAEKMLKRRWFENPLSAAAGGVFGFVLGFLVTSIVWWLAR